MKGNCRPLSLIIGVYVAGAAITLLSPLTGDPALYGALTKSIVENLSLVPRFSDVFYLNKPPLLFWLNALIVSLLKPHSYGEITIVYKLLSILFGALSIVLTYQIGKELLNKKIALWSALILALTHEFIHWSKTFRFESLYTFFILMSFFSYLKFLKEGKINWVTLTTLSIFFTFLAKGSFVVFSFLAILSLSFKEKKIKLGGLVSLLSSIVLIIFFIFLYEKVAPGFTKTLFINQTAERLTGSFGHQPWFYYAKKLLKSYQPWLLPSIIGLFILVKRKIYALPIFIVVSFFLLNLSSQKLTRYLFFLYPFLSISAGTTVVEILEKLKINPDKFLKNMAIITLILLSTASILKEFGSKKHKARIEEIQKICELAKSELCIYYPWNSPINREVDLFYLYCNNKIKFLTKENFKNCKWIVSLKDTTPKEELNPYFIGKNFILYKGEKQ